MLKEILKPTKTHRDIVIHVDKEHELQETAYNIKRAGFEYPLVLLRNHVYVERDIKRLELIVGEQLLPKITIFIKDEFSKLTSQNYPVKDELVTIRIGSHHEQNTMPIHLDFEITNVSTTAQSQIGTGHIHTLSCSLALKNMTSNMGLSGNMTYFDAITKLCTEMGLGLMSNVDGDTTTLLVNQYAKSNLELLQWLIAHIKLDTGGVHTYIDQYYRLNIVDIAKQMIEPAYADKITHNVINGLALDEAEDFLLTNDRYDGKHTQFRFDRWSVFNNTYSNFNKHRLYSNANASIDYSNKTVTVESADLTQQSDDADSSISTTQPKQLSSMYVNDTHHKHVAEHGKLLNNTLNAFLLNNLGIQAYMQNISGLLHINMIVPVAVYDQPARSAIEQNPDDTYLETDAASNRQWGTQVKNDKFSGDYMIISSQWSWSATFKQAITMTKRQWLDTTAEISATTTKSQVDNNTTPTVPTVSTAETADTVVATTPVNAQTTQAHKYVMSDTGINDLIKFYEGLELIAYKDSVGVVTIGYGHTKTAVMGQTITRAQALQLLRTDLLYFENWVNRNIKTAITQSQFDAMTSLCFNVGPGNFNKSSVMSLTNASKYIAAQSKFILWNKAGGEVLSGLTKRRKSEATFYANDGLAS